MPKPPDKFKRWMIASFFLIPLVIFGSIGAYYASTPIRMRVLVRLLAYNKTRVWAYKIICSEGASALPYVIDGLDNKNRLVRGWSALLISDLARQGIETERVVPAIIKVLSDTDAWVRAAAVMSLGALADERALPGLTKLLSDPDFGVRRRAAGALGRIGSGKAVGPLIACLKQKPAPGVGPGDWQHFQSSVILSLREITGQNFGDIRFATDAETQQIMQRWVGWWQENKEKYEVGGRKNNSKTAVGPGRP